MTPTIHNVIANSKCSDLSIRKYNLYELSTTKSFSVFFLIFNDV